MLHTIALDFDHQQKHYHGEAVNSLLKKEDQFPAFDIFFEDEFQATIVKINGEWKTNHHIEQSLVNTIGNLI